MESSTVEAKRELRERLFAQQGRWTAETRRQSDRLLFKQLRALPEYDAAKKIFAFVGTGAEPDTGALIAAMLAEGKEVAVPLCRSPGEMEAVAIRGLSQLKPGRYGIPEPAPQLPRMEPEAMDLILVPAVCYDREGYRLGRGGGYYDRYLMRTGGAFTVGLCRTALLQEQVPREEHDRKVRAVVTEEAVIRIGETESGAVECV